MAIPLQALRDAVEAGHPDHALIGVPFSLVRELAIPLDLLQNHLIGVPVGLIRDTLNARAAA